jgi:MFS transporter, DHA1 family, multidrug resistance protein
MQRIHERYRGIATILSFSLIPLSGLATDVYLPSLPAMAAALHASDAQIQLSILLFLVSAGASQLFVGALLDSFGRFPLSNAAMAVFILSSFAIAWFPDIHVLYAMRIIHGITVAIIVVAKRAYFMDSFSGERLKKYISLFSIVWATSPILAPFIGGYLQESLGWKSNFYFLGCFTGLILILTLIFGGESIRSFAPWALRSMTRVYADMLRTRDFSVALIVIGLTYSILMVFGMTGPFIIEKEFHYTPVVTGYSALLSGTAVLTGGIISRMLIDKPLAWKVGVALSLQLLVGLIMIGVSWLQLTNLYLLVVFIMLLHLGVGFTFNTVFAYALGRFSQHAGVVSGLTGGGFYVITSFFSYSAAHLLPVHTAVWLGITDTLLIGVNVAAFGLFLNFKKRNTYVIDQSMGSAPAGRKSGTVYV